MIVRHGRFLERPNRFVARVRLESGTERLVHVASSGRMTELLVPGAKVAITGEGLPGGKTAGLLAMVRFGEHWVSVDTRLPGKLLGTALRARELPEFAVYTDVRPEYTFGASRLDFLLSGQAQPPCLMEVKSVTSAVPNANGLLVARFPDSPTVRGGRHLHDLAQAASQGFRAAVCFIVQREDARAFGPWDEIDPAFAASLRAVASAGVEVHAWNLRVEPGIAALNRKLPVLL